MTWNADEHRDVTIATMRMVTKAIAGELRKLARVSSDHPEITAEQALNDAAKAVERGLANMLANLGIQDNKPH